ncbi:hypothetical protein EL26_18090 [Tumebacillus flagellatus]|uniref:NodB homology domain-containing protein n=1 Tax=Tumebacillus flagellatus TaxID=1157490 RepID=A0A074LLF9_9BACL|nr:hypothetical protein EL26_18090 [Tumebacillus flagellatus]
MLVLFAVLVTVLYSGAYLRMHSRPAAPIHAYMPQAKVPILMYHSIAEPGKDLSVSTKDFEEQLKWLAENGFTPITLGQLERYWDGSYEVDGKPVVITFDDGYLDNYTDAYPVLLKYHDPATIFIITDSIKRKNHMSWDQMKEMHAHGIEFGSHMVYHSNFLHTALDQISWELTASKRALEKGLGSPVTTFCYPGGGLIPEASRLVHDAGYTIAVTTQDEWADQSQDRLLLSRVRVVGGMKLDEFARRLQAPLQQ